MTILLKQIIVKFTFVTAKGQHVPQYKFTNRNIKYLATQNEATLQNNIIIIIKTKTK